LHQVGVSFDLFSAHFTSDMIPLLVTRRFVVGEASVYVAVFLLDTSDKW
jgi:hypothetical protein